MPKKIKSSRFNKYRNLIKLLGICLIVFVLLIFFQRKSKVNFGDFGAVNPALPQSFVNSAFPKLPSNHTVYNVKTSCTGVSNCFTELQPAVDTAHPGDEVVLQAGATFTGNVVLPNKDCTFGDQTQCWIIIRSSKMASLPPEGTRVSPIDTPNMAKIVAPGSNLSAIYTAPASHHYRLVGLEFAKINPVAITGVMILLGANDSQSSLSQVPHHFVLDRVYVHGDPTSDLKRGIELNSSSSAVVDSYVSDFHVVGQDAQALAGYNGPGPYKIANNYLEGSTENVIFGGVDPKVPNLVPSDIEFKNNYVYKPRSWRVGDPSYAGKHWAVKNIFELKNAQRVLISGNIFDGNWLDGQVGYAIVFTPRNQDGNCPWCTVQDVTFTNNIVRHSSSGVNILGTDDVHPSQNTKRILIRDNLFDDISTFWGGGGILYQLFGQISGALDSVTIDHNTGFQNGSALVLVDYTNSTSSFQTMNNIVFTNNIAAHNNYGVFGGNAGIGKQGIQAYVPNGVFTKNVFDFNKPGAATAGMYPSATLFPDTTGGSFVFLTDWNQAQFVNQAAGDYHLSANSPFKNSGSDNKDIGADINAVNAATATVISGINLPPSQPPPTPPTPTPTPATPIATINSFTLINTGNSLPIPGFDPMPNGTVLNLAALPTRNLTIRANVSSTSLGSMKIIMDGGVAHKENSAPYGACGDTNSVYTTCPSLNVLGSHSLTATPYSGPDFTGTAGTPVQLSFTVTDQLLKAAFNLIPAGSFDSMLGVVTAPSVASNGAGWLDTGDWIGYKNVNFGTGASSVDMVVAVDPNYAGKQIELHLDSITGPKIGTLVISSTGGWGTFQTQSTAISAASGVHDLYLVMSQAGGSGQGAVANLNSFKFIK